MCGRLLVYNPKTLGSLELLGHEIRANFNAAPSEFLPIIRNSKDNENELILARWGILPPWCKDPTKIKPFFNARADNLKPSNKVFWDSRDRHCLVPATGFYEWSQHDKQPFIIQTQPVDVFYIAGLWRRWGDENEFIDSFCVLTTKPHPVLADIHHRSPIILSQEHQDKWLNGNHEQAKNLLTTYQGSLQKYMANPIVVNNARNKSTQCLDLFAN